MRRSFLLRLAFAAFGMALFCAVAYMGLGWAVWSQQGWVESAVGEHWFARLSRAYENAAASLRPGDLDGDGVCDGRERFLHTDPRNPANHPWLSGIQDTDGIFVRPAASADPIGSPGRLWIPFDEPLHWRGRILLGMRPSTFPRSFRLRVTPPPGALLAFSGGQTSAAALEVPVASDGSFAFDVRMETQSETAHHSPSTSNLTIDNAATGETVVSLSIRCTWRLAPLTGIPPVIKMPPNDWIDPGKKSDHFTQYLIDWSSVPPTAEGVLVEVARDEAGAEWFPLEHCPSAENSATISRQQPAGSFWSYTGPLKFRVVPVHFSPP